MKSAASVWDYKRVGYESAVKVIRRVWPVRNHPGIDRMVLRRAIAQAQRPVSKRARRLDLSGSIPVERINEGLTEDEKHEIGEGLERRLLGSPATCLNCGDSGMFYERFLAEWVPCRSCRPDDWEAERRG